MLKNITLYNGKVIIIDIAYSIKKMDSNISECVGKYRLTQLEILDLTRKVLDR